MWKYTSREDCNEFLLSLNLFNCKDKKKYIKTLYAIANNKENNYRIYKIKKRNGKYRTIYEPNSLLKEIQRNILENILETRSVSKYCKAYYKGAKLKDNASIHIDKNIVLKLDIENFFPNITFMNIYNSCFSIEYFPKNVGMLLTYLCTCNDYLTQGSPTSAYISNLVMKKFDEDIGTWCDRKNISYSRYSDDMTFSGDFDVTEVIKLVREKLGKLGLNLNDKKTCVIDRSKCQRVTGLVVNDKVNVSNEYKKKIRQEMYYINKYGIKEHMNRINVVDKSKYINSLMGRINYVLQIDSNNKEFIEYREIIIGI